MHENYPNRELLLVRPKKAAPSIYDCQSCLLTFLKPLVLQTKVIITVENTAGIHCRVSSA